MHWTSECWKLLVVACNWKFSCIINNDYHNFIFSRLTNWEVLTQIMRYEYFGLKTKVFSKDALQFIVRYLAINDSTRFNSGKLSESKVDVIFIHTESNFSHVTLLKSILVLAILICPKKSLAWVVLTWTVFNL